MEKATADQQDLFEAGLEGSGCTFKVSGRGNLNVIGADRDVVAEAASKLGYFVVHIPAAGEEGVLVGYDAKGFDPQGLNREGQTAAEARAAKKAAAPAKTSAPEVLRDTDGSKVTKEGRRLYFATPYGHPMTATLKAAGAKWEPETKRWWIGSAGNMNLLDAFDATIQQERDRAVQTAQEAERKAAAQTAVARTWISIPFEATEIRELAKANGAKWDPQAKRWGLPTGAAETVTSALNEWKTAQRAAAPIDMYRFLPADSDPTAWHEGLVIWSESDNAYVTLVTVKRTWVSGQDDDGGEDEAGYRYLATARLATDEESAPLRAADAERAKLTEARNLQYQARREASTTEPVAAAAQGSSTYVLDTDGGYGFEEAAIVEPVGTPGRRIIFTSHRGGDGDLWTAGNFGQQNTTAAPAPFSEELEQAVALIASQLPLHLPANEVAEVGN